MNFTATQLLQPEIVNYLKGAKEISLDSDWLVSVDYEDR